MRRERKRPSVCFVTRSRSLLQLIAGRELPIAGGAEVQMARMGEYLASRGWDVSFTVQDMGQEDEIVGRAGIRLLKGYRHDGGIPGLRRPTHKLPRLWRALVRADADIYVVRGASWLTGAVVWFARRRGRQSVAWMAHQYDPVWGLDRHRLDVDHWPAGRLDALFYRYGLSNCDLVIAQTNQQRKLLEDARNVEAVVVPNVCPVDALRGQAAARSGVLWIANFRPFKRPELLLDVAERLPEVRFVMIGGPKIGHEKLYEECERRAAAMANVDFRGPVPFAETNRYFAEAAVLVLTSESEGFPNVLLQAWAHGTPVVSTFDPDGVIQRFGLGFYCQTLDEIVAAIKRLMGDPQLREEIGQRAVEYVKKHHSPEVVLPKVEQLFLSLLDKQ